MNLKPHQQAFVGAIATCLLLPIIPLGALVLLPVTFLNTHIHELAHALAGFITGAHVSHITVFRNGSGITLVAGGNLLIVASAGYMGASLAGAAMVYFTRTERQARLVLRTLALALGVSLVLLVRPEGGDFTGPITGIFWLLALFGLASIHSARWVVFAAQFVGAALCLNAVHSLYVVFKLAVGTEAQSDAQLLANYTGVPAVAWAFGWGAASIALLVMAVHRAWHDAPGR